MHRAVLTVLYGLILAAGALLGNGFASFGLRLGDDLGRRSTKQKRK